MANQTIENNFTHHEVSAQRIEDMEHIRSEAKALAYTIDRLCLNSREKSLAMTKLEEAVMWANASVARS